MKGNQTVIADADESAAAWAIKAWLRRVSLKRSLVSRSDEGLTLHLNSNFATAHDHNFVIMDALVSPGELLEYTGQMFPAQGSSHCSAQIDDESLGREITEMYESEGFECSIESIFIWDGASTPGLDSRVRRISLTERIGAAVRDWQQEAPDLPRATHQELGEKIATASVAARATFLAICDEDGVPIARVDIFEDDEFSQIEELFVRPSHRGLGLASILLIHAVAYGQRVKGRPVFLLADAQDWPALFYARKGFRRVGERRQLLLEEAY